MTAGPVGFHGDVNIAEVGGVVLASGSVPVTIVGGGGGGGTEYAEDSAHNSGDLGTQILAVRNDTPGSLVDADGDYGSVQLDSSGRVRVAIDNSPTVSVSGTVDVSGSTVTIQEPLSIDDGGGSITIDGTVVVSGGAIGISSSVVLSATVLEDDAVPANPDLFPAAVERDDALTTLGEADGDWVHLRSTSIGALWVSLTNPSGVAAEISPTGAIRTTTFIAEGDTNTNNHPVWVAGVVRADTLATLAVADGEFTHPWVDSTGALWVRPSGVVSVDDNGGSLTVDDGGSSLTVDGTVAVSSVAGTVTVSGTVAISSLIPGTGATNLGKAEDAVHASGDVGVMALAVRNDSGTVLAGTDGDYIPLTTDGSGRLRTTVGTDVSLTATRVENAAVSGGHLVFPAGVIRDDALTTLGVADNDWTDMRVTSLGELWTNSALTLQRAEVVAGAGLSTTRTVRVPVQNYGYNGLPQLTFALAGAAETFGVSMVDPSAITAAGVNAALGGLSGTGGALRTGPDRDTLVSLFSSQVFNATTSANSSTIACETARWALVHYQISSSGSPTDIRLIAQFSVDGGTTWTDYSVDQWVDLRFVPSQMPLAECVPLNHVIGTDFRLRGEATGTDGSNTFTLTAHVEFIS